MSDTDQDAADVSEATKTELAGLTAATRDRWRAVDPLLPAPISPDTSKRLLTVRGEGGELVAGGIYERIRPDSGSLDLTWAEADRHTLSAVRIAGAEPVTELDQLLCSWQREVTAPDGQVEYDSAAALTWPSRDTEALPALLDHGMQPRTVIGVRPDGRATPGPPSAVPDLRVRVAEPADQEAATDLHMEEVRYDQQLGSLIERPDTRSLLYEQLGDLLSDPEPWVWLAERSGCPVALAVVSPPSHAGWIAPLVAAGPAAYLDCLVVSRAERGSGAGAALMERVHQRLDDTGVAATLLHYAMVNPLSGPFWSRMGYRPLWTSWKTRPATTLR